MRALLLNAVALTALMMSWASSAHAQGLIAYEPFENLTNGDIVGQGSGFGWGTFDELLPDTSWALHNNGTANTVSIEDGGLSYTDPFGNVLDVAGSQRARSAAQRATRGSTGRSKEPG